MRLEITIPGLFVPPEMREVMGEVRSKSMDRILRYGDVIRDERPLEDILKKRYWKGSLLEKCLAILKEKGSEFPEAQSDGETSYFLAAPMTARADMDSMYMLGPDSLGLSQAENDALETLMNEEMRPDGVEFRHVDGGIWLIRTNKGPNPERFEARALWDQEGHMRDLGFDGPDGAKAEKIVTLTQMILFENEFNQKRLERELPAVTSFIFWKDTVGGAEEKNLLVAGHLPFPVVERKDALYEAFDLPNLTFEDVFTKAKAMRQEAKAQSTPATSEEGPDILLHVGDLDKCVLYGDSALWKETLKAIDSRVLEGALTHLDNGEISSIKLTAREGSLLFKKKHGLRFWRRSVSFRGKLE